MKKVFNCIKARGRASTWKEASSILRRDDPWCAKKQPAFMVMKTGREKNKKEKTPGKKDVEEEEGRGKKFST